MEYVPKDRYLEVRPDTLEVIRKEYNLDKPGRMKEAVSILDEWIQKQLHFKKKDFNPFYLEVTIIACKGSIERAKSQLDKICTVRTLMPHFFGNYNIKEDFGNLFDVVHPVVLPKLTNDHYRVFLMKINNLPLESHHIMNFYKSNIMVGEYLKRHDYLNGFILIVDYSEINIMDIVSKLNPMDLRQAMTIYIEGYGMRIKGIHIISGSKLIDTLVSIFKQVVSPKVAGRIHVHKTIEDIHKIVPKEMLPKEYGGDERPMKVLLDEWFDQLTTEEHLEYVREMNLAGTDENCRKGDTFTEQYAGMPGTFRLLSVD